MRDNCGLNRRPTAIGGGKTLLALISAALLGACAGPQQDSAGLPPDSEDMIAGLYIVDCLLPGQIRKLGAMTYQTPRRPVKTTAADCNIRGGEYVAYDRANYKTALKVWLPSAEAGDPKAQVSVGEIFENGLGTEPNYEMAAFWYAKAAEQGDKTAQFNLGTLYEQGKGVEQNKLKALNLYREAWGLPEDSLMYQATAQKEQEALRASLESQLKSKDAQLKLLESQLQSLRSKLKAAKARGASPELATAADELNTLSELVTTLKNDRVAVAEQLSAIPKLRTPVAKLRTPEAGVKQRTPGVFEAASSDGVEVVRGESLSFEGTNFGRYYALVIGNRNYSALEDLETPFNDAREIGAVLENKYGFTVQLLLDADRLTVMRALNELHEVLTEDDNLLIYYAGHGSLIDIGDRNAGYWLPVNADAPPNDSRWVPNEFITNHLGRMQARRVLVIADSCYGGLLSSSPGHLFFGNAAGAEGSSEYIRYKLPRRSRLLLSSGGDKPVIDGGGGGHSVFARELITILENNSQVMSAPALYANIRQPVMARAEANNFVQEPVYKSIKGAGHEVGDFFFVPKSSQ
ncbi:peptidase C14 [Spongiibacter sp. KMU-166]|uniref:Peptidase C14 n=1 Tax=Spongiibacter thalassae TaxID=2721624 RepID=A0ABX1GFH5_9GAMM|nr:caspase family protein [Spongiibacter thalassae]NKI17193.1 peptidase C14 [Spongiibacter thalassae]